MAHPIWPPELPQRALRDGYSEGLRDGRIMTEMEAGPPKLRRRVSSAVLPVQCAMELTVDAKARLQRFWEDDLAGGSLAFLMPDQSTNAVPLLNEQGRPLLDEQGWPLINSAYWVCVFSKGGAPTFTNLGGPWWRATMQIVVMP